MPWERGRVRASRLDQLTTMQSGEGELDGAFREAGFLRDRSETGADWPPTLPLCGAVETEIDEEGGRLAIVPDQIAHENIEDIIIDRDSLVEARHEED